MGRPFPIQEHYEANASSASSNSPPLLFLLGELSGETKNAIFYPVAKTFVVVELPELSCQLECLASGYGWLLLVSREASSLFFFNPLTRKRIDLVYRSCLFNAAAFSAPPTSPSCTVFAVNRNYANGKLNLDVLRVGKDKQWTRFECTIASSIFGTVMQLLYSNGALYCVDLQGRVIKNNGNWEVLSNQKFKPVGGSYIVELNGEIILAVKKKSGGEIEKLYKVKTGEEESEAASWEEVKDLGDATLFLGPSGGRAVLGLGKELQNKIFVTGYEAKTKCVKLLKHEFHGGELKETTVFCATRFTWLHASIWI